MAAIYIVYSTPNVPVVGQAAVYSPNTTVIPPVGATYSWDFGDGTTSTLEAPTHTYTAVGSYQVSLQVFGSDMGIFLYATVNVNIQAPPFILYTPGTSVPQCGQLITYYLDEVAAALPQNPIFAWDFGDGTTSTLRYLEKVYHTPGLYTVSVNITSVSDLGYSASSSIVLDVTVPIYSISYSTPAVPVLNEAATYSAATPGRSEVKGATYSWDFGDGTTSTEMSPTKTYSTLGFYAISLDRYDPLADYHLFANLGITITTPPAPPGPIISTGSAMGRRIATVHNHTQDSASTVWTVVHNLKSYPIVDVYVTANGALNKIIPLEVTYFDQNTCTISFSTPYAGYATVA